MAVLVAPCASAASMVVQHARARGHAGQHAACQQSPRGGSASPAPSRRSSALAQHAEGSVLVVGETALGYAREPSTPTGASRSRTRCASGLPPRQQGASSASAGSSPRTTGSAELVLSDHRRRGDAHVHSGARPAPRVRARSRRREVVMPNKRIKLTRRSAGGLTRGRRARSLSAVRWAEAVGGEAL